MVANKNMMRKLREGFYLLSNLFLRPALLVSLTFLAAGRIDYWQGWGYAIVTLLSIGAISYMTSKKKTFKALMKERPPFGPKTDRRDKRFWTLYLPSNFAIVILAGLDAGRFGWTKELPLVIYVIGCTIHIFSYILILWAMQTNKFFFGEVVGIRTEMRHVTVQEGPYRLIRHPGYLGGTFLLISTALILGSLWALIPAILNMLLLLLRTDYEDAMLQRELTGYTHYTRKVKFRLLPGIW